MIFIDEQSNNVCILFSSSIRFVQYCIFNLYIELYLQLNTSTLLLPTSFNRNFWFFTFLVSTISSSIRVILKSSLSFLFPISCDKKEIR